MSEMPAGEGADHPNWNLALLPADRGGPDLPALADALRRFLDLRTGADAPPELTKEMLRQIELLNDELAEHQIPESRQVIGRIDMPGRGQTLIPLIEVHSSGPDHISATTRFGRYYLGRNGAVYGGAVPLVFDSLLGRLAASGGRSPSRTAYLHVDYRAITPIDADLRVEVRFTREEGRKRYVHGAIYHGETLCAEAEGLFIALRPGQP
ncbi:PaaI family thioesterase [Actinocorallia populi]|uniref:PaaI family thioesterase n=1 Tax=Actinocorallia populi TaxID=2079200 RepID=UPI0018E58AC5|nr:PaaI family thioesterase [Actinocorallia populi]